MLLVVVLARFYGCRTSGYITLEGLPGFPTAENLERNTRASETIRKSVICRAAEGCKAPAWSRLYRQNQVNLGSLEGLH